MVNEVTLLNLSSLTFLHGVNSYMAFLHGERTCVVTFLNLNFSTFLHGERSYLTKPIFLNDLTW